MEYPVLQSDIPAHEFLGDLDRPLLTGVSDALMRHTIGREDFAEFQRTGVEVFAMFEAATIKHAGRRLHEFRSILDFGCGAGRLMQFLPRDLSIAGCDVNDPLVAFMAARFPHADIYRNSPEPPLKWPDGIFDLVYSFSVFSHLKQDSENRWLAEFNRVGRAGCLYMITVQGDWWIESKFDQAQQARLRPSGFTYFDIHTSHGGEMDFPENYGSSLHTSDYVRETWGAAFDILQIYKGRPPMLYDDPALSEAHRAALQACRSMGQDLVVMRKRADGS